MSMKTLLSGIKFTPKIHEKPVRNYSITSDILSYKRCRRQYGFFGVRGFSSSTNTQRYFGTLVHDVLDQINRDFKDELPERNVISHLIDEASKRLILSGVRPYNTIVQKEHAIKLIDRFVKLIGPHFFQYVYETEYQLERALTSPNGINYTLQGVVDILSGAVSHSLGLNFETTENDTEIWDYKSSKYPIKPEHLQDYKYQMAVYAELFKQQKGYYPARCVLVFLGELGNDKLWNGKDLDIHSFSNLLYVFSPEITKIKPAIDDFHATVEVIEAEREKEYSKQWLVPEHSVEDETCDACELRYNCSNFERSNEEKKSPL